MATRLTLLVGTLLLLSGVAFMVSGCQDDSVADGDLPPPSFQNQTLPPPVAPQPAPVAVQTPSYSYQQTARAPVTTARRPLTSIDLIPASWIPHVAPRPWQWIVIHHTATSFGDAAIVTRWHIGRGFDEMGYHFLIGNGTNSGDGQVEVGTRWPKQKWGAHTKSPDNRFNDFGIGICLVGNFDLTYPTSAQMRSLDRLVAYLMKTYHIPPERVLGHNDCKSTDCPGKHLNVAVVRRAAVAILATDGVIFPVQRQLGPNDELIRSVSAR